MSVNSKDQAKVYACSNTGLAMICKEEINGVHTGSVYATVHYGLYRDMSDIIASLECKFTVVSVSSVVIDIWRKYQ